MLEELEVLVEEETHVYSQGGVPVNRSATGLLKKYGLTMDYTQVPLHVLEMARQRGKAIAIGSMMIALGLEIEEKTIDDRVAGYLAAFRKFWRESNAELIETEFPRISPMGYGFTPDLICWINGRRAVVDGKATFVLPKSVGPQTAAYKIGWTSLFPLHPIEDRFGLWLKKDGTYKSRLLQDPDDETAFLDCLDTDIKLEKWRLKYGS